MEMENSETILDAVRAGDVARVAELLDAEPELIQARNELGQSAVLLAKYHRKDEVAALLVNRGVRLDAWEAAAVGDVERVMEMLDTEPDLVNAHSQDGFTPLGLAAFFGHETIVHNLLAKGANPDVVSANPMRVAPLHSAVAAGQMGIVRLLVEAGANVNAPQQQGFTALHGAAAGGDELIVRYLLAKGAAAEARAENGQTALDLALAQGHGGIAELLG
jgi:ankyrin repeat protein